MSSPISILTNLLAIQNKYDGINTAVMVVFIVLTSVAFVMSFKTPMWKKIWGQRRTQRWRNQMCRMLVFTGQPYKAIVYMAIGILISMSIGAAVLFVVGGIGYLLLWLVKILLWLVIVVGFIGIGAGVVYLFKNAQVGLVLLCVGLLIVCAKNTLSGWGNTCVEAGFDFFSSLNVWNFCLFLVDNYSGLFFCIAMAPVALGLSTAISVLVFSLALIVVEKTMTIRYNIKHPCPYCHNPSEPAVYLSRGKPLPVRLRPGVYGLFHITHPTTGEKMPTMLLNGRDRLTRQCPHCGRKIKYRMGIEKHIAFVGLPQAGKTCLTYAFLGGIMRMNSSSRFTDEINREAKAIIMKIKDGKEFDMPSKTGIGEVRRSLQILFDSKHSMPYHFFVEDVGGGLFTTSGVESENLQFFKDIESISILIDPFSMDFSEYEISGDFAEWYKKHIQKNSQICNLERMTDVFQTIKSKSDHFINMTERIHINLILVKIDTGYLDMDIAYKEEVLREFMITQMGLAAEIMDLEHMYASLHFYAVSAIQGTGMGKLIGGVFKDLNIN